MAGELTVDVMGEIINQSSISEMIGKYPIDELPPEFVGFLEEAVTLPDTDPKFITVKDDWYGIGAETAMLNTAIDEADLETARNALDDNSLVAVKLPIQISPLDQPKLMSEISVFLAKPDHLARTKEIYVRSGLVIGEEQHLRHAPGRYYGLVRANHSAISEFLGFAEEASHMKWNSREEEVRKRYAHVMPTIAAVRHSMPKLAKLLLGYTSGRHDDALIDFLFIPDVRKKGPKAKATKRKGKSGGGTGAGVARALPRFRVAQAGPRWTLTPGAGAQSMTFPTQVRIDLAYSTMPGEGDPFKVYHRFEFDLADQAAHTIGITSGTILSRDLNRLEVALAAPDFEVTIDGFSEHALKSRVRGV